MCVTLAAAALRLWRLDQLPPGLWYDEAVNGVDIRMVLSGRGLPIYFAANNGREPLFIYLQALSTALLGPTPLALRIVAAIAGIVTVPVVYWCGRLLFASPSERRESTGSQVLLERWGPLLAAAALAVSYWHLSISRLGLRAILLPLTSTLAVAFFWKAWTGGRRRDYLLAGVCMATALYSYLAARLLPFVLVAFVAVEAALAGLNRLRRQDAPVTGRPWKTTLVGLALMAGLTGLLFLPLARAIWAGPPVVDRSSEVSIFTGVQAGEAFRRVGASLLLALRAFYDRGDMNVRHNVPGRPATDFLTAALFTLGWLTAFWRLREARYRLLLIWFGVMLLPTVLSIEAPHSLRASGALPAFALLCGLGGATLISALPRPEWRPIAAAALLLLLITVSGGLTGRDYFVRWPQSERLGPVFTVGEQLAAEATAQLMDSTRPDSAILISDRMFSQPQMAYALGLLPQSPIGAGLPISRTGNVRFVLEDYFDPQQPMYLLTKDNQGSRVTPVEPLSGDDAATLQDRFGRRDRSVHLLAAPGQHPNWATVFEGALPLDFRLRGRQIANPLAVSFGDGTRLLGYDVGPAPPEPDTLSPQVRLTLFWEVGGAGQSRAVPRAFVHLANDKGVWQTRNGLLPEHYLFPWLESARQIQDMRLVQVPNAMPAGKAFFETGLYVEDSAGSKQAVARVGIVDGEGRVVADQVNLGATMIRSEPPQADLTGLQPLDAAFDERISLLGWSATRDAADTGRLRVDLAWRSDGRSTTDYTAFIHLLDAGGQIVAQSDQPPGGDKNPTTRWVPGETVRTTAYLKLDPVLDLAAMRLRVGLYEPVSGKQLPLNRGAPDGQATFLLLPLNEKP
ncbi:MAG: hypothetical protein ACM30E_10880 [Nitrososphaerales archaeon]